MHVKKFPRLEDKVHPATQAVWIQHGYSDPHWQLTVQAPSRSSA